MLEIIRTASVIILFILCIVAYRKIQIQHNELLRLYNELDKKNRETEINQVYDNAEAEATIIPVLYKIQTKYRITKTDKLHLLDYFSQIISTFRYYNIIDIIYTINVGKTFTYKEATNNIIDFINKKHNKDMQIVVESLFYLITKEVNSND